jgi:hypothetical protein
MIATGSTTTTSNQVGPQSASTIPGSGTANTGLTTTGTSELPHTGISMNGLVAGVALIALGSVLLGIAETKRRR